MKKFLLSLALMGLFSSFMAASAYAKDWIDLTPDGGRRSGGGSGSGSNPDIDRRYDDLFDVDLNDNGVFESFEWSYVFDRDVDSDGVLDHQDPDSRSYIEYVVKRLR